MMLRRTREPTALFLLLVLLASAAAYYALVWYKRPEPPADALLVLEPSGWAGAYLNERVGFYKRVD